MEKKGLYDLIKSANESFRDQNKKEGRAIVGMNESKTISLNNEQKENELYTGGIQGCAVILGLIKRKTGELFAHMSHYPSTDYAFQVNNLNLALSGMDGSGSEKADFKIFAELDAAGVDEQIKGIQAALAKEDITVEVIPYSSIDGPQSISFKFEHVSEGEAKGTMESSKASIVNLSV